MCLIKDLRLSLNLPVTFVAEQTGLTIQRLENIELGAVPMPDELINFYSSYLNANPKHLQLLTNTHKGVFASLITKSFEKYISLVVYLNAKK